MMLPFRKEQQDRPASLPLRHCPFDPYDQLLPDAIHDQVLLRRMNTICQPQQADPLKKREYDLVDGLVDPSRPDMMIEPLLEKIDIQVDHVGDQLIEDPFLPGL